MPGVRGKWISAGFQPTTAQAPAATDNGPIAALAAAGAGWGSPLLFPFPVPHVCSWLPATVSAGNECSWVSYSGFAKYLEEGGADEPPFPHPPDQELTLPIYVRSVWAARWRRLFLGIIALFSCLVYPGLYRLELNTCLLKTPYHCLEESPVLCAPLVSSGSAASNHPFNFQGIPAQQYMHPPLLHCVLKCYSTSLHDQIFYFWLKLSKKQFPAR